MIPLIIIFFVSLLIFSVLLIPIKLYCNLGEQTEIKIKYLFISKNLNEKKIKKVSKKSEKKISKKEKKFNIKEKIKKDGLFKTVYDLSDLVGIFYDKFKYAFIHIVIHNFDLQIKVSSDNAADTAIKYGRICAVVYPALGFIESNVSIVKKQNVNVFCEYDESDDKFLLNTVLSVKPLFILISAVGLLFNIIKIKIKKDGTKNEQ